MAARPVQVSIDETLLRTLDSDPETRKRGRSAVVRDALQLYFADKRRRAVDDDLRRAYAGRAGETARDVDDLIRGEAWPDE